MMKNSLILYIIFSFSTVGWSCPTVPNNKKEVPILCYHNIKNFSAKASPNVKTYTTTPTRFAEQMKALHDNDYHTISPDELYNYLIHNTPLPPKPIMLTFDDTRAEQFTLAVAEMNKYNFKGVFFIMTVSIGKSGYMTKNQIKKLSQIGHTIGLHTWDHTAVTRYNEADWKKQLIAPRKQLENLIGKPVNYFSYPFGLWNQTTILKLKSENFKLAFILSSQKDKTHPEFTVRRKTIAGTWSTPTMLKVLQTTFH